MEPSPLPQPHPTPLLHSQATGLSDFLERQHLAPATLSFLLTSDWQRHCSSQSSNLISTVAGRPEWQLSGRKCKSSRAGKRGQLAYYCVFTFSLLPKPPSWLPYWQVWTRKGCLWCQVKTRHPPPPPHVPESGSSLAEPGALRMGLPGWRAWEPWCSLSRKKQRNTSRGTAFTPTHLKSHRA